MKNSGRRVSFLLALMILVVFKLTLSSCNFVNGVLGRSADSDAESSASVWSNSDGNDSIAQVPAVPVVAVEVARDTISQFLIASTTLTAERSIDIVARTSGIVTDVFVEEGDTVRAGELLVRLDQTDSLLSLSEARARYENSKREYERSVELFKHNAISVQDMENQQYQLELLSISLERTRRQLENTEIRSPLAGVVSERVVQTGSIVFTNARVFHIVDMEPVYAVIHIPSSGRSLIKKGIDVQIHAFEDVIATGSITNISPIVDPTSGSVKATIKIDQSDTNKSKNILVPGTFVTVKVPTETRRNVIVVPKRAILQERDQSIVYLVQEGVAIRTPVTTGLSTGELVEVSSGVSIGTSIITVGQESIRDGALVRVVGQSSAEADSDNSVNNVRTDNENQSRRVFNLEQIPNEQRQRIIQRLLENTDVKAEYESKLKEDPTLESDEEKRIEFFQEQLQKIGGPRVLFAGNRS